MSGFLKKILFLIWFVDELWILPLMSTFFSYLMYLQSAAAVTFFGLSAVGSAVTLEFPCEVSEAHCATCYTTIGSKHGLQNTRHENTEKGEQKRKQTNEDRQKQANKNNPT